MNKKQKQFVQTVFEYYKKEGRHTLPWRKTKNPYRILVSEIMLQQTQVDRVIPKYKAFLSQFPTIQTLADAPLSAVLIQWQGLGYNRRAKMLHNCAKQVISQHRGKMPKTYDELVALSGIGPYTAGAVMAFAYNTPRPIIETNIRTVFIYHFFNNNTDVTDTEILQSIGVTMDMKNPREWYWALMDYGSFLKKEHKGLNSKSKHYVKQSKFAGSHRQIRGAIVRTLAECGGQLTRIQLHKKLATFEDVRVDMQLQNLQDEEMIQCIQGKYLLAI